MGLKMGLRPLQKRSVVWAAASVPFFSWDYLQSDSSAQDAKLATQTMLS